MGNDQFYVNYRDTTSPLLMIPRFVWSRMPVSFRFYLYENPDWSAGATFALLVTATAI